MAAPSSWSLEIVFVCCCIAAQTNASSCISDRFFLDYLIALLLLASLDAFVMLDFYQNLFWRLRRSQDHVLFVRFSNVTITLTHK